MSKSISPLAKNFLLVCGITLVTRAMAADFPVGMDWQRQQDYTKAEQEGEPSVATMDSPWYYTWGNASPDQWDVNASSPLIWQSTWFGHARGVWAQYTDRLPLVEQKNLNISLNPPKSIAACYVRWKNPSSKTIKVKLDASLKVSWHGSDGSSSIPLQIAVFTLNKGEASAELYNQSVTDQGSPQTNVSIDLSDIQLASGDEIIIGFKGEELPGGNRYISVADDISIQLTAIVP